MAKRLFQNKSSAALRRRRPASSSLGLNDRLRKIASALLLASGSTALANRLETHSETASKRRRVLAIASGGGHWVQLMRLRPALENHDTVYAMVHPMYRSQVEPARSYVVPDATRWNKLRLVLLAAKVLWILLRERPEVVISTGAAPGFFALKLGKLLGARTIWVDSIANVERVSESGRRAGKCADLWLTQWPHLSRPDGPHFRGAVL